MILGGNERINLMSRQTRAISETHQSVKERIEALRRIVERTVAWKIWERLLEATFIDRSVALAGKAFISFFPLVIVVAAFVPERLRKSIVSTLVHRLGLAGPALATVRQSFSSASDIRRATGILGLILTIFFATSFTRALQRMYQAAWRRPSAGPIGAYSRGGEWIVAIIVFLAALGSIRKILPGPVGEVFFVIIALALSASFWWFTAWLMMLGQVRPRALLASGAITGVLMSVYALSAAIWMPRSVLSNNRQFGFFGIAISLVSWFSGAAICIMIGACAGAVLVEDTGALGRIARFGADSLLVEGAPASLAAPTRGVQLADAFKEKEEDPGT
jgi:membrane protein